MTRKWLAVLMLIFLAPAVVFVLSGCGGGGGGGTGGGSMMPVGGEPVYNWTKKFGGEFSDYGRGRAVATDSSGNIYIAGSFTGLVNFAADFDGAETKTSYGNTDIFVTRINANGTHAWTRQIGGAGNDGASGIAVDTSGNVYVVGYFEDTVNFKADFGGAWDYKISVGLYDAFVTKLSSNGAYVWTKQIGGTGNDGASGIAVDAYDNIYVAGSFEGTVDFRTDFDGEETKTSYENTADIFVMKINADDTYGWTKRIGGTGHDGASGIAVDSYDNVYVVGYFEDTVNFKADFGGEETKISYGDTTDIFVTKINDDGAHAWTKQMGGTGNDGASGIAVDMSGNVYVAGYFEGTVDFRDDFDGEETKISYGDTTDIFVTRIDANGTYGWTKRMGGAGADAACAVAVDSSGGIYVTGHFEQTVDFRADFGGNNTKTSAGNQDIFITKVSPDGTYGWSRRMGGVDDDYGLGITVNQADVVYMTGFFTGSVYFGSDFGKSDLKSSSGQTDVFLTKITP